MSNNKSFVVKNGLQAGRYLGSNGIETAGSVGYNLSNAEYDSVSLNVSGQEGGPTGIVFKPDGTKMYISGYATDSVYQYSLSTAFDLSTASYDSVSFNVGSQDLTATNLAMKDDGTKLYILGTANDSVYQYSLSTAFDLSTASYDSVSFSVSSQDGAPFGLTFSSDGSKMFMCGAISNSVFLYNLSTAWDLSTASYGSVSFIASGQVGAAYDVDFNSTGSKMYVLDYNGDVVYQYGLSVAFDLSTASYDNVSFSVTSQDTAPNAIAFSSDGSRMYMAGDINASIYQYSTVAYTQTLDLSTGTTFSFTPSGATTVSFTNPPASGKAIGFSVEIIGDGSAITWPSSVKWHLATAPTATATKELYTFVTTDGGTTYYGKKAAEGLA